MELLIVLAALAIPIAAIAGFIMALTARDRLRQLELRFAALEARVAAGNIIAAPTTEQAPEVKAPSPAAAPQTERVEEAAAEAAPPALSPQAAPALEPERPGASFEERFGTQWVVWIGRLALALGGLFLVRYSIE